MCLKQYTEKGMCGYNYVKWISWDFGRIGLFHKGSTVVPITSFAWKLESDSEFVVRILYTKEQEWIIFPAYFVVTCLAANAGDNLPTANGINERLRQTIEVFAVTWADQLGRIASASQLRSHWLFVGCCMHAWPPTKRWLYWHSTFAAENVEYPPTSLIRVVSRACRSVSRLCDILGYRKHCIAGYRYIIVVYIVALWGFHYA